MMNPRFRKAPIISQAGGRLHVLVVVDLYVSGYILSADDEKVNLLWLIDGKWTAPLLYLLCYEVVGATVAVHYLSTNISA